MYIGERSISYIFSIIYDILEQNYSESEFYGLNACVHVCVHACMCVLGRGSCILIKGTEFFLGSEVDFLSYASM